MTYGLAYAAASLGCTLPIFLTVVGAALTAGGWGRGAIGFVLYGLGMGLVVSTLTLGVALLGHSAIGRAGAAGAVLLLLADAYVVYYWLTLGGLLSEVLG